MFHEIRRFGFNNGMRAWMTWASVDDAVSDEPSVWLKLRRKIWDLMF